MCLEPWSTNHSLHAALLKRKISDGIAVVWYAEHLYVSIAFDLRMTKKEKKEQN